MPTTKEHKSIQHLLPYYQARKPFYQFLHLLFSQPITEQLFFEIHQFGNIKELASLSEGGRSLYTFFKVIKSNQQLEFEKQEYQRLFVGPGPILAPPWESVYRSKEKLLFDVSTFQVRQEYHRFGLQYTKENNEPDDHLLIELEFMIFLIDASLQNNSFLDSKYLEGQIHFLKHHLTKWIPLFTKQLAENTSSSLYFGAAQLLNDFITDDLAFLNELKEEISYVY